MSKVYDFVMATLAIGVLAAAVAQAQQVLTVPLGSQPLPTATPLSTATSMLHF